MQIQTECTHAVCKSWMQQSLRRYIHRTSYQFLVQNYWGLEIQNFTQLAALIRPQVIDTPTSKEKMHVVRGTPELLHGIPDIHSLGLIHEFPRTYTIRAETIFASHRLDDFISLFSRWQRRRSHFWHSLLPKSMLKNQLTSYHQFALFPNQRETFE